VKGHELCTLLSLIMEEMLKNDLQESAQVIRTPQHHKHQVGVDLIADQKLTCCLPSQ